MSIEINLAPWQAIDNPSWRLMPLKRCFEIELGQMLRPESASHSDVEVPYLKSMHVQWDGVQLTDLPAMWATPTEIENLRVEVGDLLVCEGGDVGRAALVTTTPPESCIIQNALHRVRGKANGSVRFLRYLLRHAANQSWFDVLCNRATIAHFTVDKFKEMQAWLPTKRQQEAIADFLDYELHHLDQLAAARQQQLVLLEEKRRAIIAQAVTQGLDAQAPRRDSGFAWLESIPAHWQVVRLRFLAEVRGGLTKGRKYDNAQPILLPYLRVANVQAGYLNLSDVAEIEVLEDEIERYSLKYGDVLMNEGGDADKLGRGAMWREEIKPCLHQNHVFAVRCFAVNPEWLATVSNSEYSKAYFESRARQSTNLASISSSNIKEFPVVMPPPVDQKAILDFLEREAERLNTLRTAIETSLSLLQQKRASLITAAVTGQLPLA